MTHQAKETEYKGVRFRSRSEAMFAVALGRGGADDWMYEPPIFEIDGWSIDFAIPCVDPDHRRFNWRFIEYKPAKPTELYLEQLAQRVSRLRDGRIEIDLWCCWIDWFALKSDKWSAGVLRFSHGEWAPGTDHHSLRAGSLQSMSPFLRLGWVDFAEIAGMRFDLEHK